MEGFNCTGLSRLHLQRRRAHACPSTTYSHGRRQVLGHRRLRLPRHAILRPGDGTYFFADYCTAQVWSLALERRHRRRHRAHRDLAPGVGQSVNFITSFGEDNDGELYICDQGSGGTNGELFAIVPDGPFTDLGSALPGVDGNPVLDGVGSLEPGSVGCAQPHERHAVGHGRAVRSRWRRAPRPSRAACW